MTIDSYPLFEDQIPGLATKSIAGEELYEIKRDIAHEIIKPDNASPSPAYSFNSRETPTCIHSNKGRNLSSQSTKFRGVHNMLESTGSQNLTDKGKIALTS